MIQPRVSITQLAYLVKPGALNAALDHWINVMGAGPFYVGVFPLADQTFRGKPTDMTAEVAVGYHGDVQMELINPTNNAPGPYSEWLEKYPQIPVGGIYHHIMVNQGDFDATYDRHLAAGCKEGFMAKGGDGGRIAYLDAFDTIGGYIEIVESSVWPLICKEMREVSRQWDGANAIRGFDTLSTVMP